MRILMILIIILISLPKWELFHFLNDSHSTSWTILISPGDPSGACANPTICANPMLHAAGGVCAKPTLSAANLPRRGQTCANPTLFFLRLCESDRLRGPRLRVAQCKCLLGNILEIHMCKSDAIFRKGNNGSGKTAQGASYAATKINLLELRKIWNGCLNSIGKLLLWKSNGLFWELEN